MDLNVALVGLILFTVYAKPFVWIMNILKDKKILLN